MNFSAIQSPSVCIVTLGCAKNEVDSAKMESLLVEGGYQITSNPEQADAIIINTCSFIQDATEESLEVIFDMAALETVEIGNTKIIVAGCMPARYGDNLAEELSEVNTFVPCSKEDDIVKILQSIIPIIPSCAVQARRKVTDLYPSAYVKISEGCDRFCSYCTIPFIRGRYYSLPFDVISAEVTQLVEQGVGEVVLIAQDTGRWGSDLEGSWTLAKLIESLAQLFPDIWFRVMYIQPEGISDELLNIIASYDNVCSYLDIPLQHIAPHLLQAMNRKGGFSEFENLLSRIRSTIPSITLRTTFIVGFPGESEQDFENLLEFVEKSEFDYVGVFPYSCEDGTKAALLPNQIDENTKLERAQALRDKADAISTDLITQRIGQEMDVVVLGREEDGQLYGRAHCQAPDVDGIVYLQQGDIGKRYRVTIVDAVWYDMEGEQLARSG